MLTHTFSWLIKENVSFSNRSWKNCFGCFFCKCIKDIFLIFSDTAGHWELACNCMHACMHFTETCVMMLNYPSILFCLSSSGSCGRLAQLPQTEGQATGQVANLTQAWLIKFFYLLYFVVFVWLFWHTVKHCWSSACINHPTAAIYKVYKDWSTQQNIFVSILVHLMTFIAQ